MQRSQIQIVVGWASDFVARRVPVVLKVSREVPIEGVWLAV